MEKKYEEFKGKVETSSFNSLLSKNLERLKDEDIERRKSLMEKLLKKIQLKSQAEPKGLNNLMIDKHPLSNETEQKPRPSSVVKLPTLVQAESIKAAPVSTKLGIANPTKPRLYWYSNSKGIQKSQRKAIVNNKPEQRPKTAIGFANDGTLFNKSPDYRANEIRTKLEAETNRLKEITETKQRNRLNFLKQNSSFSKNEYENSKTKVAPSLSQSLRISTPKKKGFEDAQIPFISPSTSNQNKKAIGDISILNQKLPSPYIPSTFKPHSKATIHFTQSKLPSACPDPNVNATSKNVLGLGVKSCTSN